MDEMSLRASDADRDQVAELLHAAYAEGRITVDEHEERTAAVIASRTFAELDALTADLVPAAPADFRPVPTSNEPDRVSALLSEGKRVGHWVVPPATYANTFMGSILIDLTEATFTTREIEINCSQFMGEITVRVPIGTTVWVKATNVLGDNSVKGIGERDPRLPTVVITGTNVLGQITVRGPKKPRRWRRHVT